MDIMKPEENNSAEQIQDSISVTENNTESPQAPESHGAIVAAHYNALEEKGLTERNKSRIVHLRNFNNWIKSMLINEYMDIIKESKGVGSAVRVLDMCCGKGGDLLKWRNADIKHLVCADIAETSMEQCRLRYEDMSRRQLRERRNQQLFSAEFHVADCTKVRLREKYKDASLNLDLVSCQFSFHYSFESLPQAECMLRNAAECLQPGGYFIGTIPDANDIVKRFRANGLKPFGNEVYKIEFENSEEPFPLFGAKYNFTLMEVVNCPEFLVHFPTLERLAKKHGLELVSKVRFEDYYANHKDKGRGLLGRMQALETYPTFDGTSLSGKDSEYVHAKQFMESHKEDNVGTLSQPEWEAVSLYMVFAFRKMKPITRDAHGRPVYEQKSLPHLPEVSEELDKRTVVESRSSDKDDDEEQRPKKLKIDSATS